LDGEVVMHRKFRRPIFIVFDVLAISTEQPVLHLPFEQRLQYLRHSSFRTDACGKINGDPIFDPTAIKNPNVALPLVRKNFVKRTALDQLFSHVVEERGTRTYRNGEIFHHLTDGIIFQPNMPYTCGTDIHLLKWKYLDTVTIDVEILPPIQSYHNNNGEGQEDILRVGVLGDEGSLVDMTRFVKLPSSERRRLEADRHENHAKIAEVGFDPTTGEWYYLTMRPDKIAANHISTVLGTLLELAESLSTEELRYRMSVPPSSRDTYHKDVKGMLKQILEHQRKKNRTTSTSSTSTTRPSSASSSQQPR
jgi:mRNA guanylyltransferase